MAQAAPKPCRHPGCRALVASGYCDAHQRTEWQRIDRNRGSSTERGYDATWRKLRAEKLRVNPFCECDECKGGELRLTPANIVDHIIAIEERPDLRLEWSNLRSMSKLHHDRRTARDQAFGRAKPQGG